MTPKEQQIARYVRDNNKEALADFLIKNYTIQEIADIAADYFISSSTEGTPKIRITEEQFNEYFSVIRKGVVGRRPKQD